MVMAERNENEPAGPASGHKSEKSLVERFKQADESAFEEIVKLHITEVTKLANRLLGWPGDVDDVVQNVFFRAYLGLRQFRCQSSLKTWLFTITINQCRKQRYKNMLSSKLFSKLVQTSEQQIAPASDRQTLKKNELENVREAVRSMPAKYSEPVVLKYLQEMSTSQISRLLGISENAVQVRLSRARKRLKEKLGKFMEQ